MKTDSIHDIGASVRGFEQAREKSDTVSPVSTGTGTHAQAGGSGSRREEGRGKPVPDAAVPEPNPRLLAARIMERAKGDFAGQDYRRNFRHVTSSAPDVPERGLGKAVAFAVKAELESLGLSVALIRANPTAEAYHLEISVPGGTLPRDAVTDPLLESAVPAASGIAPAEGLVEAARHLQGAKAYGLT